MTEPLDTQNVKSSNYTHTPGTFMPGVDAYWMELARAHNTNLPIRTTACTPGRIEHWLHKFGLSVAWFRDYCGLSPAEWMARNPGWNLRSLVGLLLEELP